MSLRQLMVSSILTGYAIGVNSVAWAAVPVVYQDSSPEEAVNQVATVTGVPPEEFEAYAYETMVREAKPFLSDGGTLQLCVGSPSSNDTIKDAVSRARTSIDYMEDNKAIAHLKAGVTALTCLEEPLNNEVAAELYFLLGFLKHAVGDEQAALVAFRNSHGFVEGLGWNYYFTPEAAPLFEQAKSELAAAEVAFVEVLPPPAEGTLWLDGQPALSNKLEIKEGEHFIQIAGTNTVTFMATISGSEQHQLVLANQLPTDVLGWVAQENRRAQLEPLFASNFGNGQTVYAMIDGAVWSHVVGQAPWQLLVEKGGASKTSIENATLYAQKPKKSGLIAASVSGVSSVVAIASMALTIATLNRYSQLNSDLEGLPQTGDNAEEAVQLSESATDAKTKVPTFLVAAGTFGAAGAGGAILSITLFNKAKHRRAELPEWHPYALNSSKTKRESVPAVEAASENVDKNPAEPDAPPADADSLSIPSEEETIGPSDEATSEPADEAKPSPALSQESAAEGDAQALETPPVEAPPEGDAQAPKPTENP